MKSTTKQKLIKKSFLSKKSEKDPSCKEFKEYSTIVMLKIGKW